MKLPVLKTPEYLSPSSFKEFESCQYRFYLRRMARLEYLEDTQGLPAAVGSAFDAMLISSIAQVQGLDLPEFKLETMLKDNIEPENMKEVVMFARRLFEGYVKLGCFDRLLKEGIGELHTTTRRVISNGEQEVVVLGKPDLKLTNGTVLEVKVNGAFSKSGQSPKPGYLRYVSNMGDIAGPHDRCGEYLEAIDPEWAAQTAIYTWLDSGLLPFRDVPVGVEQVAIRGDKFVFASIRTKISMAFQIDLWTRMHRAWVAIQAGEIADPMPSKQVCHAYGQVCVCAAHCDAYQKTFGDGADPVLQGLMN